MNADQINNLWDEAVKQRAALAEEMFAHNKKPTPTDVIAVALAHPEAYEIVVRVKG